MGSMGTQWVAKFATVAFCTASFFFAKNAESLKCYHCSFVQDRYEECTCRTKPVKNRHECLPLKNFSVPYTMNETDPTESRKVKSDKDVWVCAIILRTVEKGRWQLTRMTTSQNPIYSDDDDPPITSTCNLNPKSYRNKELVCHCNVSYCNDQVFDFPDYVPITTPNPCPPKTSTTTTTTPLPASSSTQKTTTLTTELISTTPCDFKPPTPAPAHPSQISGGMKPLQHFFFRSNYKNQVVWQLVLLIQSYVTIY